jgi:hypothetical protein
MKNTLGSLFLQTRALDVIYLFIPWEYKRDPKQKYTLPGFLKEMMGDGRELQEVDEEMQEKLEKLKFDYSKQSLAADGGERFVNSDSRDRSADQEQKTKCETGTESSGNEASPTSAIPSNLFKFRRYDSNKMLGTIHNADDWYPFQFEIDTRLRRRRYSSTVNTSEESDNDLKSSESKSKTEFNPQDPDNINNNKFTVAHNYANSEEQKDPRTRNPYNIALIRCVDKGPGTAMMQVLAYERDYHTRILFMDDDQGYGQRVS